MSLYTVFIDYEKAFDTVNHVSLFERLIETGLSCKIVKSIKSLYEKVLASIKFSGNMSDFFEISIGVKQGEPLSALLFILFINDISTKIDFNNLTENDINELSLYLMLFADDIVLFTTDASSLQSQIDCIYRYSNDLGLKINVSKTKICIFEKRKKRRNIEWKINGNIIEIVDQFCYLGVRMYYNGNLSHAVKALSDQGLQAMSSLSYLFQKLNFDVETKLSIFDKMVKPILTYCSEVWGVYNFKEVDKLHYKFCKRILGVKTQTPNLAVLGELGRFSLTTNCKERALKMFIKIKRSPGSLINIVFQKQCEILNTTESSCNNWAQSIKTLLDEMGFSDVWYNFDNTLNYLPLFKQRLRDQFIQEWREGINNMPKLESYAKFKTEFGRENIYQKLQMKSYKNHLVSLD